MQDSLLPGCTWVTAITAVQQTLHHVTHRYIFKHVPTKSGGAWWGRSSQHARHACWCTAHMHSHRLPAQWVAAAGSILVAQLQARSTRAWAKFNKTSVWCWSSKALRRKMQPDTAAVAAAVVAAAAGVGAAVRLASSCCSELRAVAAMGVCWVAVAAMGVCC